MVDTIKTQSELLTNVFQDGQAPGSITAQDMRDLVVSMTHRNYHGFFDYNDATTAGAPISCLAGIETKLTNDGAGPFTQKTYAPNGVTDVWNSVTNQFDFSELHIGTMVNLRISLAVTTLSNNTDIDIKLVLAIGSGGPYELQFIKDSFKTAGVQTFSRFVGFYIGNDNTKNFPAELRITCDNTSNTVVDGWYACIIQR